VTQQRQGAAFSERDHGRRRPIRTQNRICNERILQIILFLSTTIFDRPSLHSILHSEFVGRVAEAGVQLDPCLIEGPIPNKETPDETVPVRLRPRGVPPAPPSPATRSRKRREHQGVRGVPQAHEGGGGKGPRKVADNVVGVVQGRSPALEVDVART